MKQLRIIIAISGLLFIQIQQAAAQYYFYDNNHYETPLLFEFGGSVGVMNCLTDVGGKSGNGNPFLKDLTIGNNQLNGSIYLIAMYKYAVGLRIEGTFGRVKAYDSISKKRVSEGRYERSLEFRSKISEVSLIAEIHPLFFVNWNNLDRDPPRLSPYLAAGIGYLSYNPQATLNNNLIDLQPLSTEGQGFAEYANRPVYKLTAISIPIGMGLKYELSPDINVRLEFLGRILNTDYLDDLSTRYINPTLFQKYFTGIQLTNALALNDRRSRSDPDYPINQNGGQLRGNPNNKDSYFNLNFKLGITFGREKIRRSGPMRF